MEKRYEWQEKYWSAIRMRDLDDPFWESAEGRELQVMSAIEFFENTQLAGHDCSWNIRLHRAMYDIKKL